jgi:hypothetical protein
MRHGPLRLSLVLKPMMLCMVRSGSLSCVVMGLMLCMVCVVLCMVCLVLRMVLRMVGLVLCMVLSSCHYCPKQTRHSTD